MGYRISKLTDVDFVLYHNDHVLCKFSRDTFRADLEQYASVNCKSSQWVGRMLSLFLKAYPSPKPQRSPLVERYTPQELREHLRFKGYCVYTPLRMDLDDMAIIHYLEKLGDVIQGHNYHSPAVSVSLN